MVKRTGCAAKLRAYVAEHPGSLVADIAAAIGEATDKVSREAIRLSGYGMLTKTTGADRRNRYTFARPAQGTDKEAKRKKRVEMQRAKRRKVRAAKPKTRVVLPTTKDRRPSHIVIKAKPTGCQTVDEFLAHGGVVERLPTKWTTPDRIARHG